MIHYKTKILFDNYSLCSLYAKFDMFSDAAIKAWQTNKEKLFYLLREIVNIMM